MVYAHKWSPISYRSSAGQRKFAGQRPTFYHCATQPSKRRWCICLQVSDWVRVAACVADWHSLLACVNVWSRWIQWEPVEYFDNKVICDLVESKPNGIIAIMVSSVWYYTPSHPRLHDTTIETLEQYFIQEDDLSSDHPMRVCRLFSVAVYSSDIC